ncbi:serine/threonine protein kinase [Trichormus variabilis ATCC 29413]|uniref:Serine/threonine protein kinase n=2 Tax=Anabaena variabilis TaxID=264691 RepID=Q3ME09_TRIV2|nr:MULTISPECIES: serine/threonine-protein kinase [Nostocaceae]ABA20777.1 serine/threonine protein kinase [Trichormus variabilis ATCC 29413]MBC1213970.1 serine/threonine protein kinase [Trichormus variabilis ARAD]MBC1255677.1 serine/threonine protein kinase [Trichormus variabilis V5]MBC1266814.1 serine/threonine protein kinase [Trichormus variabilis FSR]MBC1302303.1 serine/threonine protein kinase [Trichormus variabilis N2B]
MQVIGTLTYKKIQQIGVGQGCNSQVFLIDEEQLGGLLVAKEVDKRRFHSSQTYFQEAKIIFASQNPNVVPINYACETPNTITLVMPYFSKGSLADRIQQNPLSLTEVIRMAQGVLNGLHHIHIKNYLHLDIKPSNIFFSNTDQPMIADFGQSDSLDQNGIVHSPQMYFHTLPPESFPPNATATVESDIYLMGVTLYRAINGDQIFNSQKIPINSQLDFIILQDAIQRGKLPDQNYFLPHVTQSLRKVIRKALNVDPKKRYKSAIELADALGKIEIPLDWNTQISSNGDILWIASQGKGKPYLGVELVKNLHDLWNVNVFTDNQGTRRKKLQYCRESLTFSDAETHLEKTFATLA